MLEIQRPAEQARQHLATHFQLRVSPVLTLAGLVEVEHRLQQVGDVRGAHLTDFRNGSATFSLALAHPTAAERVARELEALELPDVTVEDLARELHVHPASRIA